MAAFKVILFALLVATGLAYPDESQYDNYEYEEEPVDYGQPPEFEYPDSKVFTAMEGGKITLPCQLTSDTPYVLIVKKAKTEDKDEELIFVGEVKVPPYKRYKLNKGMLEISNLRPSDSGNYICRLESTPYIEVIHRLDVQYAPKMRKTSDAEQVVQKDSSVKLECEAVGNPTPTIRWSKEGGRLPSGAEEEEGLSMTLEEVNRHVEGTYICTADNGIGEPASASMAVTVEYPPEILTEKAIVRTGEGDKVELVCIVHARPNADVVWTKDERQLQEDTHLEEHDKGHRHSLRITDVTESDFGEYICEAANRYGTASASIHMTGHPKRPHMTSDPNGGEETSYTLTWETESYYPILEYRLRYRKAKANVSTELPGEWQEETFEATDLESNNLIHKMKHTLNDLQPATDYHAAIQVKNRFTWSANSEYAFSTKKEMAVQHMTEGGSQTASLSLLLLLLPALLLLRT